MSLRTYNRKRDFTRTPEPPHAARASPSGLRFVVQQHDASHMHFDFRLEFNGVLKSWAVPKGPSLDPNDKRLAVQVEDHPVAYANFEGIIPKGQYGGGNVIIWDEGTWTPVTSPRQGLKDGKLTFTLDGHRLQGEWALVRLAKSAKNWLLIKHRDKAAQAGPAVTQRYTRSVRSHQRVQDVGDATASDLPQDIAPALATLVERVPQAPGWLFELKWDGYRAITTCDDGNVKIHSRNGLDWSAAMATVADACKRLPCDQAIIDGEVVVLDRRGVSRFGMLQEALHQDDQAALRYIVFDLLYLNGHDLRGQPLLARKRLLESLIKAGPKAVRGRITYSAHALADGDTLFAAVERMGMEGIIAKRQDAVYQSRRTRDWLKIKCIQQGAFIIGGYTPASTNDSGLGALLLGTRDTHGQLVYAGRVGTGFGQDEAARILAALAPLRQPDSPFAAPVPQRQKVRFVQPQLTARVAYTEWTPSGSLRHPAYLGMDDNAAQTPAKPSSASIERAQAALQAVGISHPTRVLYPDAQLNKQDIASYYAYVGERMLGDLSERPLTLLRCPEGLTGESFWQRHVPAHMSKFVRNKARSQAGEPLTYVNTVEGLVSLAQIGVLEMHAWGCHVSRLQSADLLVFDLDPAPDVGWTQIVDATLIVREALQRLNLRAFVRRTGGKGLHVAVPILPVRPFDVSFHFTHFIAVYLEKRHPKMFTSHMQKHLRDGKIFVDYLRNRFKSSAVANYSTRARPGAPVAWPLHWQQLTPNFLSEPFGVREAMALLQQQPGWQDPWDAMRHVSQGLTDELCEQVAAWKPS